MRANSKRKMAPMKLKVKRSHFPIFSIPTFNWKYLAHKMNWVMAIVIWVINAVNPAPAAPYLGIRKMFRQILINTPVAEMMFNSFKFPFAVRSVPKTKFMEIPMKLNIKKQKGMMTLTSWV
jgi:hypothetical protein